MATIPVRHRRNLLFNLLGLILIVGGIGLTIYGIAYAIQVVNEFDPFRGDSPPVKTADGAALAFWGIIVFTIGRYFWRGSRTRGPRDRFGRLLIVCAYVLLGIGLDAGVHSAVDLWNARTEESMQSVVVDTVLTVLVWGVPASVLGMIGIKLADEEVLATAEVNAGL